MTSPTRVSIACFSKSGADLASSLARGLVGGQAWAPARFAEEVGLEPLESLGDWAQSRFCDDKPDGIVFVGATGIAVRAIAPFISDKFTDPAVVAVDEAGRFAVPLICGHVGGANELARAVAAISGGTAAISTASDVRGVFPVDEWATAQGLQIGEREAAQCVSVALLENRPVRIEASGIVSLRGALPDGFVSTDGRDCAATVHVGPETLTHDTRRPLLRLVPRCLTVGVGCRRGTDPRALAQSVDDALESAGMDPRAVERLATVDVKADEPAVLELARTRGWELTVYSPAELAAVPGTFAGSEFVLATVGVDNVCERAASADGRTLVAGKRAWQGTTVALGARRQTVWTNLERGGAQWLA